MPMNFPNMESLRFAAQAYNFRQPEEGELEAHYRSVLAAHVERAGDFICAQEIRTGKGWDQWDEYDSLDMLIRATLPSLRGL